MLKRLNCFNDIVIGYTYGIDIVIKTESLAEQNLLTQNLTKWDQIQITVRIQQVASIMS